jgi:cyanate permease
VPIAATAIAADSSWREALLTMAVVPLVLVLPFAVWVVRAPRPDEEALEQLREPTGLEPESTGLDLSAALRTRSFWILAFALFAFYFYFIGVLNHLIAFLSDSGYSDAQAARRFGAAIFIGIFGKLVFGMIADRIPVKAALLVNFGLLAVASILLLYVELPGVLTAFLIIHGFSVAAENVVLPLIVVEAFGIKHMAQIYGALMFVLLPGGALGPIFAARMFDTRGSYDLAFETFAILNVITLVALCFVRREREAR